MKRYSALGLLRNALDYNRNWPACLAQSRAEEKL